MRKASINDQLMIHPVTMEPKLNTNPGSAINRSLLPHFIRIVIKIRKNLCAKWYTSTKICLEVVESVYKKFTEGPSSSIEKSYIFVELKYVNEIFVILKKKYI